MTCLESINALEQAVPMTLYVRVKGKREKWHPAVYYGTPSWPSHSFWMVPGFRVDID